jgi:GWxTD domain-containing protein
MRRVSTLRRKTSFVRGRLLAVTALLALLGVAAGGTSAQPPDEAAAATAEAAVEPAADSPEEALAPRYRQWLASVEGLITPDERAYFLGLAQDYQRDAFMEAFWEPRDPEPLTRRNELRDRWQQATAGGTGLPTGDPRFMLYLLNGPPGNYSLPDGRAVARCFSRRYQLEIWFYGGSERTDRRFAVIFFRPGNSAPYRTYLPGDAIRPVPLFGGLPTTDIQSLCADELLRYAVGEITRTSGYYELIQSLLTPPAPSSEWLADLALSSTEPPAGAETLQATATVDYPARRQSRTAVRVLLRVGADQAPGRRFDGRLYQSFQLTGEVIRDGRRFESFSYRFEGPVSDGAASTPLGFTRYLRPGPVTLRLLLHDVFSDRYAQIVQQLEVPSPAGLPADPGESLLAALGAPANGAENGGPSLRLDTPRTAALAGPVRFTARAQGELDKVTFLLDDRPVFTLLRPPWSAELNLGPSPAPHRVRVVGYVGDREVASDQIWLNQGAARFRVRLAEPRDGGIYPGSLTARVEVETPAGERPERVEIWLNQVLAATLREPPLERSLELPGSEPVVVRAVAYLEDGSSAEDAVLVNASGLTETVQVRLVEIPVLVVDREGQPIADLKATDFRLFDDGEPRTIQRILGPGELTLQAALLIDRSASMQPTLARVGEAAAGFARAALAAPADAEPPVGPAIPAAQAPSAAPGPPGTPSRGRLAVFSFADSLVTEVGFTDRRSEIERALAGLVARGGTRLYDAVATAAASFGEQPGQRTLVLFTDGRDEGSRLDLVAAVAAARRHRVTIFVLAPAGGFSDRAARREIERLAEESGGRAWLLDDLEQLDGVYRTIAELLAGRYLLTFAAPADAGDEPRELRVEVERDGASVEAQGAYYP